MDLTDSVLNYFIIALFIFLARIGEFLTFLRTNDYRYTNPDAQRKTGNVNVIFLVLKRAKLNDLSTAINAYGSNAFDIMEGVKMVKEHDITDSSRRVGLWGFTVKKKITPRSQNHCISRSI